MELWALKMFELAIVGRFPFGHGLRMVLAYDARRSGGTCGS